MLLSCADDTFWAKTVGTAACRTFREDGTRRVDSLYYKFGSLKALMRRRLGFVSASTTCAR